MLQIQVGSRLTQRQELLEPYGITPPLWAGATLVLNPDVPRTAEVDGVPEASQMVSILGATWLLMDQRTVAEVRQLEARPPAAGQDSAAPEPSPVSMVELRRKLAEQKDPSNGASGRKFHSRWSVEGHWRQQACGPRWSQRKPLYITNYTKGPADAPMKTGKVHVFRR